MHAQPGTVGSPEFNGEALEFVLTVRINEEGAALLAEENYTIDEYRREVEENLLDEATGDDRFEVAVRSRIL